MEESRREDKKERKIKRGFVKEMNRGDCEEKRRWREEREGGESIWKSDDPPLLPAFYLCSLSSIPSTFPVFRVCVWQRNVSHVPRCCNFCKSVTEYFFVRFPQTPVLLLRPQSTSLPLFYFHCFYRLVVPGCGLGDEGKASENEN